MKPHSWQNIESESNCIPHLSHETFSMEFSLKSDSEFTFPTQFSLNLGQILKRSKIQMSEKLNPEKARKRGLLCWDLRKLVQSNGYKLDSIRMERRKVPGFDQSPYSRSDITKQTPSN